MAEKIKGITIAIGGDTIGLDKALKEVNSKANNLQSELRQVERLLKLDPTNTDLLAQKQELLGKAVGNAKDKLEQLKTAQEQINEQFARGEINEEQYRALQREVIKSEQDLSKLETKLKDTGSAAKKAGLDIKEMGEKIKGAGQKMSTFATAPIVAGFALVTQGTKELRGDLATLETNAEIAGQGMEVLDEAMVKLQAVTGETDSNVEGLSELLATGFRDEKLTELLDSLYGASIKFKDTMKFEGIADGLQETLATGAAVGPFSELLERSGIVLDDFNAGLAEAIANGTQEKYVLDTLAKTGLSETYDAYRKNNEEMIKAEEANFRMQEAMAQLGATLEPILTPIIEGVTSLINKFNDMDPAGQKVILIILGIIASIGPLLVLIGTITSALPVLGTAFGVLLGPVGLVIAIIAAAIAIGVLLYKNWDEIIAFASKLATQIKTKFTEILNTIKTTWTNAITNTKETWTNIVTTIKDTLTGAISSIVQIGGNIVEGLWNGINGAASWIKEKIQGFASGILDNIKDVLGINSPSKVMRDQVGLMIGAGIAAGIMDSSGMVNAAMQSLGNQLTTTNKAQIGITQGYSSNTTGAAGSSGVSLTNNFYSPKALDEATISRNVRRENQRLQLLLASEG